MVNETKSTASSNVWLKSILLIAVAVCAATLSAQEGRKVVYRAPAEYPELARRMRLSGTVKVEVTILPSGTVKSATLIGGHPVLAQSALEAAKRYKYSPSGAETTQILEFDFHP